MVSCARLAVHCAAVWQQSQITDDQKGFSYIPQKFWTIGKIGQKCMSLVSFCCRTISTNIVQAFALISRFSINIKAFHTSKDYIYLSLGCEFNPQRIWDPNIMCP